MNIGSILRRAFGAFARRKTGGGVGTRRVRTRRSSPEAQAAKGIARTVSKKL